MSVDRVLDSTPFYVAWRVVTTADGAQAARSAGWSLWRPDRDVEVERWRGLTQPREVAKHGLLVATIRHVDVRVFAGHVVAAVQRECGAVVVRLRSNECSGDEYQRRMSVVGALERRSHRQSRDDGRPVLGHCQNCGQPLTDPVSARRGYGPVCRPRGGGKRPNLSGPESASTTFRVAGTPVAQWRRAVLAAAQRSAR